MNECVTCVHLQPIELWLRRAGHKVTYMGQAWSDNCRIWIYFDVVINRNKIKDAMKLADCIEEHVHTGTHSGREAGFICRSCFDGVMGII